MNKLAVVVTVAAVATLAGCKDPDYLKPHQVMSTDEVKQVEAVLETPAVATAPEAEAVAPVETVTVEVVEEPKCQCPAGTVHQAPCKCGAADCKCKVAEPEPETTEYIVQRGDTLSAISKRYNIKIASIMAVNPKMTSDKLLIGQRIKLPGKVEVGEQKVPAPAPKAASKTAAKDA
ncbi:MAG: LysM peptidoglycan-binding domain-containing protein, partial [Kiritimatiellae bacterium]|nr:LysM peptidoglycan-binding domain-containing protein [Kiritimatiellia bacterium]